ncbi:7-cyano-7-deazaguanine synthase QueC [Devosia aquimaris]|jgi:7-cyano-7-deazaguanine synthase|uniref:7-cyano-7-deazaguanine synthase QueC n=1 Tax=Devosia aquimaris TaxID=2866214 RepID=UPI001CD0BD23|nr:7-cyano-7-deazaguanine synthase QueC [Devosia sp. CJK-A8-3]
MSGDGALVLFSGGQDSATCLAWALDRFERVETIGFNYGQRHVVELDARIEFRAGLEKAFPAWAEKLGDDRVLDLSVLGEISDTALTREVEIATTASGLPNTFVPGRNIVFLTFAAAVAYRRGLKHVVTGVCETDFSGYPDCRDDTIKALQVALNLGMQSRFVLDTPLMWIDKAQTWLLAEQLGGPPLVDLIRDRTLTCYNGDVEHNNEWGRGCGGCPACDLRAKGYQKFRSMARETSDA